MYIYHKHNFLEYFLDTFLLFKTTFFYRLTGRQTQIDFFGYREVLTLKNLKTYPLRSQGQTKKYVTVGTNQNLNYQISGGLRIHTTKKSCVNLYYPTKKIQFLGNKLVTLNKNIFLFIAAGKPELVEDKDLASASASLNHYNILNQTFWIFYFGSATSLRTIKNHEMILYSLKNYSLVHFFKNKNIILCFFFFAHNMSQKKALFYKKYYKNAYSL